MQGGKPQQACESRRRGCGARKNYVTDGVDEYIGCIVNRRYDDEVSFQYRLRGNNLVHMNEVTDYINGLLASRKRSVSAS